MSQEAIEPITRGGGMTDAGSINVCSLLAMPKRLETTCATHLISVINPQMQPPTPPGLDASRHLRLSCSDICGPRTGRVCPSPEHIEKLIDFARSWNRSGPLLVHCLAGVSRSTAAAYIVACALNPAACEARIAGQLRRASATAEPNRLLIELADDKLGRQGRMVQAIAEIGPGELAGTAALPFGLSSHF